MIMEKVRAFSGHFQLQEYMMKQKHENKRVPFEFIIDILKWLLELNLLKLGIKKPAS